MGRNIYAIVNPVSGRRDPLPLIAEVQNHVERLGGSFQQTVTERAGHASEIAADLPPETDALLVVGGDGTVSEVLNGLGDSAVQMVLFRGGTENLLAWELGMPEKPEAIAETLLFGQPFSFDVGTINDRRFGIVFGAGFDAECVHDASRVRTGHITRLHYALPIARTLWRHRPALIRVDADGQRIFEGRGQVVVGLIARYGGGMRILANARHNDGLLDVCIFPYVSRFGLVWHGVHIALRRHVRCRSVIYDKAKNVRISSADRVPIQIDGDPGGWLPVEAAVVPGGAKFLRRIGVRPELAPKKPLESS